MPNYAKGARQMGFRNLIKILPNLVGWKYKINSPLPPRPIKLSSMINHKQDLLFSRGCSNQKPSDLKFKNVKTIISRFDLFIFVSIGTNAASVPSMPSAPSHLFRAVAAYPWLKLNSHFGPHTALIQLTSKSFSIFSQNLHTE